MRFFLLILLLAAAALAQDTASPGYGIFGRSATFSVVTNINNKSNDVINQSNDYVAATDGNLLLALVSSNGFGTKNSTGYNGVSYLLEMRQPLDSVLFLTFTRGTEAGLKAKIASLKLYGMIDTRFGSYNVTPPAVLPVILRLEYSGIDITGRSRIGPGAREILVENLGRNANNVTKVGITVIR